MPRKKSAIDPEAKRVARPKLPRSEPNRAWSTLFGAGQSEATNGKPKQPAGEGVQRGVELGYRVIDEYVKQGTAVANAFTNPSRPGMPLSEDLPKMTERMMQYASDFSSLWFDAMGVMLGGMNGANGSAPGAPVVPNAARAQAPGPSAQAAHGVAGSTTMRPRYVLDVKSAKPAEIIVAFNEQTAAELKVEPLRARSKAATIEDVQIAAHGVDGPLRVKVHVPASLAAGRYTGAVTDAKTGAAVGRLTVVLRAR